MTTDTGPQSPPPRPRMKVLGREMPMPRSRMARTMIGSVLIAGGCLGFLPVLGFWMIPAGLLVLSYDSPRVRRLRRRSEVWWANRYGSHAKTRS